MLRTGLASRAGSARAAPAARRGALACLVALLALAAAAPPAGAQEEDEEDGEPRIGSLRFEGVDAVDEDELLERMVTRRPPFWRFWKEHPRLARGALAQDMERIEAVYRKHGYYEAQARYEIEWDDAREEGEVTIHVEEGAPVHLTDVALGWTEEAEPPEGLAGALDEVASELALQPGDIFTVDAYRESRNLVIDRLAQRAHPAARIEGGADVDVTTREARVDWRVEPGPRVVFGPVTIEGLEDVGEHVVRRELRVEEGESYTPEAVERTHERLVALQLFRYVSVIPQRDRARPAQPGQVEPVEWPVAIEVRERPPRTLSLGGGWGSDEGPRGTARFHHRNFFGDGRRLDLGILGSQIRQDADGRVLQPYVFGTQAALEAGGRYERRDRDSYVTTQASLLVGPRRALGDHWEGEAVYRFGWISLQDVEQQTDEVLREQRRTGLLSGVGLRFRRADLDEPRNPTRGTWFDMGLATNLRGLGSDFDWMRYDVEARGFLPVGPVVAAGRLQVRTIDPFGPTEPGEVPLPERLYLGGAHLGRGFPFEELGPLDSAGDPVGGTSSVLASVELRFPIWRQLAGAVFVDAGQVSLDPFDFTLDDVGVGVGPGLALATPIGAVGIYAGYPVRPLETDRRWRFHLSVGYAF